MTSSTAHESDLSAPTRQTMVGWATGLRGKHGARYLAQFGNFDSLLVSGERNLPHLSIEHASGEAVAQFFGMVINYKHQGRWTQLSDLSFKEPWVQQPFTHFASGPMSAAPEFS